MGSQRLSVFLMQRRVTVGEKGDRDVARGERESFALKRADQIIWPFLPSVIVLEIDSRRDTRDANHTRHTRVAETPPAATSSTV